MTLTLRVLQTPKGVAPPAARPIGAAACPFTIGRGPDNDWVLEDPDRIISKQHCRIEADGDGFYLVDLSSNGVFFASEARPLGRDRRRPLDAGDSFRIGEYRIALGRTGAALPAVADGPVLVARSPAGTVAAGPDIAAILTGTTEGSERRAAQTVTGTASEWLAAMPGGTVDERIVQPMRWQAPPAAALAEPPEDMMQPLSAFADRSEHVPAVNGALPVGGAKTLLPLDWNLGEDTLVAATLGGGGGGSDWPQAQAAIMEGAALMRLLPDAAREGGEASATVGQGREALVRTGQILRRLLDALAAIEAVQRTSERELGLGDDAISTEDLPGLLAAAVWTADAGATDRLIQRVAGLARHARAFSVAVAETAGEVGAQIQPAAIEDDAREAARLAVGPLLKAASWERYCAVHANLCALSEAPPADAILAPLRRSFAQRA